MDLVDIDGLHIAYERAGNGPPLVLLHGYVGDGPTTWRRQLDALCDEFTVIAWDAPGAGRSSDPPERSASMTMPTASLASSKHWVSPGCAWPDSRSAASSRSRCSADTLP